MKPKFNKKTAFIFRRKYNVLNKVHTTDPTITTVTITTIRTY